MLTISHNGNNPITEIISTDKYTKWLELCLESKSVNVTKRKRFATLSISIVDNSCLLLGVAVKMKQNQNAIAVICH